MKFDQIHHSVLNLTKKSFFLQYFKDRKKDELLTFLNSCLSEDSIKQLETSRQEDTGYLAEFIVQMAVRDMSVPDSKCSKYCMILFEASVLLWLSLLPYEIGVVSLIMGSSYETLNRGSVFI